MQDNIIQELLSKFNNKSISYSLEKCQQLYEKTLKLTQLNKVRDSVKII